MSSRFNILKLGFALLILLAICGQSKGQDEFFTSYRTVPLTLNPAEAGRIATRARLTTLARTQWNTISGQPYRAGFAGLELQAFCLGENFFGGSLTASMEESGASRFQRLNAQAGLSYHQKLGPELYLSGGAEIGLLQHRLGNTDLRFDAQYDGTEYIPNRSTGEEFLELNQLSADASVGLLLYQQNGLWSFGFSIDHLFSPSMSFLEEDAYTIGLGLVVHGQTQINGWENDVRPAFIMGVQGMYRQYALFSGRQWHSMFGTYGVFDLKSTKKGPITSYVKLDTGLRIAGTVADAPLVVDAFLLSVSFVPEGWQYGITYDATLSRQNQANGGFGGLELFVSIPIAGTRNCVLCPSF